MCPFCLANLALIGAGAASTSGLTALAVKKFLFESGGNHQTNETGERQSESRDIGTEGRKE